MPAKPAQIDTTIEVVTPENIAFHYQAAGPFRRLVALGIDMVIRFGILFCLGCVTTLLGFVLGGMGVLIYLVSYFILDWFYGGLFETFMNGQTPGKWVMGVRVLTTEGQPINGLQAITRNVLRWVDMMPFLSLEMFGIPAPVYFIPTFMLGLGFMMMNRRFQRLGDVVCGTMVVIEERQWLTGVAKLDDPRAAVLAEYLPADYQVSRSLGRALSHYVERRRYFSRARLREVARHLGDPLIREFGLPSDTSHDLLLCALYYRTFISDRGDDSRRAATFGESPFEGQPVQPQPQPPPPLPQEEMVAITTDNESSRRRSW